MIAKHPSHFITLPAVLKWTPQYLIQLCNPAPHSAFQPFEVLQIENQSIRGFFYENSPMADYLFLITVGKLIEIGDLALRLAIINR
jgi:hypothetical protein